MRLENTDLPPKKWTGLGRHMFGKSWADVAHRCRCSRWFLVLVSGCPPLADLLDGLQGISNRYVSFAVNVAHSVSEIYGG